MLPVFVHDHRRVVNTESGEIIQTDQRQRARARRTLELYGMNVTDPEPFQPFTEAELHAPVWINWHYSGTESMIGTDIKTGADFEYKYASGKVVPIPSVNKRAEIVAFARVHGAARASRKFGYRPSTIRSWMNRNAA